MNSIQKLVNSIKLPSFKTVNLSMNINGSGLLYNKPLLYFIFIISFGNFLIELMSGDIYFIIVYLLIGFLTTFFSKNMIVVLLMSAIFANILKYGAASVEGFEEEDPSNENNWDEDISHNTNHKNDMTNTVDEIVSSKPKKGNDTQKDSKQNDSKQKEPYSQRELDDMKYNESEKLIENQNLLLKNMQDFKPFLDTIQGIAKSFSGSSGSSSSSK
jgi:hypothetical protein